MKGYVSISAVFSASFITEMETIKCPNCRFDVGKEKYHTFRESTIQKLRCIYRFKHIVCPSCSASFYLNEDITPQ